MAWPDAQQIIKAMMVESDYIDPTIRNKYSCKMRQGRSRRIGMEPDSAVGGFAVAFKMIAKNGSSPQIYYRVFCRELNESMERRQKRIDLIQSYIKSNPVLSPYFVDFAFVPRAISVGGMAIPGMRMESVEGLTLGEFLMECLRKRAINGQKIRKDFASLASQFYSMITCLESLDVAHGDLSCENIIITPDMRIKLIDYDSIYVPTMKSNFYQTTAGSPYFQHHERISSKEGIIASNKDDFFSSILIYLFLYALSFDLSLLDEAGTDEDVSTSQFIDKSYLDSEDAFIKSPAYKKIERINDKKVIDLLSILRRAIAGRLSAVPSLIDSLFVPKEQGTTSLPHLVEYCTNCGHKFTNDEDLYCTQCGAQRLRYQEAKGTYKVRLINSGQAKLQVIKVVKEFLKTDLRAAKDLIDSVPRVLASGLTKQNAREFINELEEAGADAELI